MDDLESILTFKATTLRMIIPGSQWKTLTARIKLKSSTERRRYVFPHIFKSKNANFYYLYLLYYISNT